MLWACDDGEAILNEGEGESKKMRVLRAKGLFFCCVSQRWHSLQAVGRVFEVMELPRNKTISSSSSSKFLFVGTHLDRAELLETLQARL